MLKIEATVVKITPPLSLEFTFSASSYMVNMITCLIKPDTMPETIDKEFHLGDFLLCGICFPLNQPHPKAQLLLLSEPGDKIEITFFRGTNSSIKAKKLLLPDDFKNLTRPYLNDI